MTKGEKIHRCFAKVLLAATNVSNKLKKVGKCMEFGKSYSQDNNETGLGIM